MKTLNTLVLLVFSFAALAGPASAENLAITDSDFDCVLDMQPVRGFYVDNLLDGKLADTLAVAKAGQGEYPAGSVVQLVPSEVMVKHPQGYSVATRDWEFFELSVSPESGRSPA